MNEKISENTKILATNVIPDVLAFGSGILFLSGNSNEAWAILMAGGIWGVVNAIGRYRIASINYAEKLKPRELLLGIPIIDGITEFTDRLLRDAEKPEAQFLLDTLVELGTRGISAMSSINFLTGNIFPGVFSGAWVGWNIARNIRRARWEDPYAPRFL